MDIVSHLLELIETQKIVGINALGSLYKKKIPGRYDSETHSFLPPKYEIVFTTEIKETQELANFISEKKAISIESANYYITEFVENIHAQLADHQHADFSPLGKLKLINDQIVLEASDTMEIGFDFYGLPSVTNHQEQVQHDQEIESNTNINEDLTPKAPTSITDPLWRPTVINDRYQYDDEDENHIKGRGMRIFLKILVSILVITAVFGTVTYFVFPNLFYSIKENFIHHPIESHTEVMIDTNSKDQIDSTTADSVKKEEVAPIITKDSLNTSTQLNHETTYYEVIGSAMKTQKKVDQVISNLSKVGINAKKMEALPGRLIKISLGTFTEYNLAKKFQDSLKIKLKNPEIYIQTIKPKN